MKQTHSVCTNRTHRTKYVEQEIRLLSQPYDITLALVYSCTCTCTPPRRSLRPTRFAKLALPFALFATWPFTWLIFSKTGEEKEEKFARTASYNTTRR